MPRILVTGSRKWDDSRAIERGLNEGIVRVGKYPFLLIGIALVSGACPSGADALAESAWKKWGGEVERHPADWNRYGKRAGYIRNAEMVALGADICLAFIKDNSRGATMTADLAENAGIPTLRFVA